MIEPRPPTRAVAERCWRAVADRPARAVMAAARRPIPICSATRPPRATLLRAWETGRLPHAWLLRGPRGVGKATLAYRFARRLLAGGDHERAAADPTHPIFRMVMHKAHPDLRVLSAPQPEDRQAPRDIPVDQVRAADQALHATAARDGSSADRRRGRRAQPVRAPTRS